MSRWQNLPASEQEALHLAATTTSVPTTTISNIRRNIGGLIRQEFAEPNQILCYYRNVASDSPIPYMCDLGCCPTGCCSAGEFAQNNQSSLGWAVALLVVLVLVTLFVIIALLSLHLLNKHKDRKQREQIAESSAQSSAGSQISGPYYGQDAFYPYVTNVKTY
uniref:CX domain-containing protein n=1 Tax=Panagrolaimus sp. JU765 TaxID=591449 RepID=A0AC34QTG1_9BILA